MVVVRKGFVMHGCWEGSEFLGNNNGTFFKILEKIQKVKIKF